MRKRQKASGARSWWLPTWEVREQRLGGKMKWMIYRRWLWFAYFFELWDSPETAAVRVRELNRR